MERNWEKIQYERDLEKVKKINICNTRSMLNLFLGLGCLVLTFILAEDMARELLISARDMLRAYNRIDGGDLFSQISMGDVVALAVTIVFALFFMFRAMFRWEEKGKISESRYIWEPDEEEIEDIERRFDNSLVRYLLSHISPTETESLEISCKDIRINSNEGTDICNFNKCGFSGLDNYGTKQLAYYLATHAFPDGFVIYQTKIAPAGAYRYLGGVTDVRGEAPSEEPDEEKKMKRLAAMLNWLAVQIQTIFKLKTSFRMPEPDPGPSLADSGQTVINKGFSPDIGDVLPL